MAGFRPGAGQPPASPSIDRIFQFRDTVGVYEKFELMLNLKVNFENPYDPDQVDIMATFTSPSGRIWNMPGFYTSSGFAIWRVRFAPDEAGTWAYTVHVKDRIGEVTSEKKTFVAIPSLHHGPLRISANRRFLEYHDGKPFFGVGFWYNDGFGRVDSASLDELKRLGVNFISSLITPIETLGTGVGRYDQQICGRLDELLELLESRDMVLSMNVWFHSFLSETVWGGGNIRWPNSNPYQYLTAAKDFYGSEEAWKYQEKMYRYLIARYSYSRALGIWFVVDEVNGTDGWVSGDSVQAGVWAGKVQDYLKNHDPYNHMTTGTRSGGRKEYWDQGYKTFDMAGREIYEAQGWPMNTTSSVDSSSVHPLTLSYRNYHNEISKMWKLYNKPIIIGETGWDHTFYEPSMPGYLAQYHNALWTALSTGSAMTPFWWAYSNVTNDAVITRQLLSIRKFADAIPLSSLTNLTPVDVTVQGGDGYGMKSDQLILGWVVNPKTDVAGDMVNVASMAKGMYKVRIYHTWNGEFVQELQTEAARGTVSFKLPTPRPHGHADYVGQDVAFIVEPVR